MNTRQTIKSITCALSVLFAVNTAAAIDEGYRSFAVSHLENENARLSFKITNPSRQTIMLRLTAYKKGTEQKTALLSVSPKNMLVRGGSRRDVSLTYYGISPETEGNEYDLKVELVPIAFSSTQGAPESPDLISARDWEANIIVEKSNGQINIQAKNLTPVSRLKAAL